MKRVHNILIHDRRRGLQRAKALLVEDLRLPIHICLGHYEAAPQEELHDIITDITHELDRRAAKSARAA